MFSDDLPKAKPESIFPRNIETLSVSELEEYIGDLDDEITKVKADIKNKKSSQDAAAAFFK